MGQRRSERQETTPVATFTVTRRAYLDAEGHPLCALPEWAHDAETLRKLLQSMLFARVFDARAVALQRTGGLGTYASGLGQEAVPVGVADAMRPQDVLLPSYREPIAQHLRGVALEEILRYWGGDECGSAYAHCRADFPPCIPVGSQLPHAAGVAFALKRRGEGGVAVTFIGDGGTSKGDFYEAINLAGVWQLPLVVVINNNQWAISVARQAQTAAQTLAQKAIAAGIDGIQVDGNDVIAVRQVTSEALTAAAKGRATVIEAVTYRVGDHTTADDASRYRAAQEVEAAQQRDPIRRLQDYLQSREALDDGQQVVMEQDTKTHVEAAVEAYRASPARDAESLFDHLYAESPPALTRQRSAFLRADDPASETSDDD
ncbi:MAG: pyruvate dehydrogenase (acetyl-transferring) E1 component subunit alpha [Algiphilus sp.]